MVHRRIRWGQSRSEARLPATESLADKRGRRRRRSQFATAAAAALQAAVSRAAAARPRPRPTRPPTVRPFVIQSQPAVEWTSDDHADETSDVEFQTTRDKRNENRRPQTSSAQGTLNSVFSRRHRYYLSSRCFYCLIMPDIKSGVKTSLFCFHLFRLQW